MRGAPPDPTFTLAIPLFPDRSGTLQRDKEDDVKLRSLRVAMKTVLRWVNA